MKIAQKASSDTDVSGQIDHMKVCASTLRMRNVLHASYLSHFYTMPELATHVSCLLSAQGLKWEFAVINDEQVNAFVVPGGKVVVYTGLLRLLQGRAVETQLAAVLGHEIAHVVARHSVSKSATRHQCM